MQLDATWTLRQSYWVWQVGSLKSQMRGAGNDLPAPSVRRIHASACCYTQPRPFQTVNRKSRTQQKEKRGRVFAEHANRNASKTKRYREQLRKEIHFQTQTHATIFLWGVGACRNADATWQGCHLNAKAILLGLTSRRPEKPDAVYQIVQTIDANCPVFLETHAVIGMFSKIGSVKTSWLEKKTDRAEATKRETLAKKKSNKKQQIQFRKTKAK